MSPLAGLRLVFALNAIGIAVWFPRIPDVKAALEIDLFLLALCFFMLPLGTMLGFLAAPGLLRRFGARAVCLYGGPLFILSFLLPAFAGSAATLALALLLAGISIAPVEVAINAKASEYERVRGRRVMTSCHAAWSLGAMSGALVGGAAGALGVPFLAQQLALAPLFAAFAYLAARPLIPDQAQTEPGAPARRFALPDAALLGVCLLPMGALMIEGAMMEWSALFLRGDVGAGPLGAAAGFAGFALAMAVGRLAGDPLATRHGARTVIAGSALVAGVGMFAFSAAPSAAAALPAAVVLGLGVANIYPLALSLAAETPGRSAEDAIATVAFTAFTVFLVGPPFIGSLGSLIGLPGALMTLTLAALYPAYMIRRGVAARPSEEA